MEIIDTNPKQRPGLVTALCILTFIGSGFGILNNIFGIIMSPIKNFLDPEFFQTILNNVHDKYAQKFVEQAIEVGQDALKNIFEISLTQFILYVASITGAILMFQLKRLDSIFTQQLKYYFYL